jgi:hypothetical protein
MARRCPLVSRTADKEQGRFSNYSPGSAVLPFVISTGAQRSGEICGSAALPWKCFQPYPGRSLNTGWFETGHDGRDLPKGNEKSKACRRRLLL